MKQESNRPGLIYLKGMAMGVADLIPGISGGTVALITGVYESLINSISKLDHHLLSDLFKGRIKEIFEKVNIKFLLPLVFGILSSIVLLSRIIHYLLEDHSRMTWSFFFGLIIASYFLLRRKTPGAHMRSSRICVMLGALAGIWFSSLLPSQIDPSYLMTFVSGMIAIIAMILPGISGSFLLIILGQYKFITGALKAPLVSNNFMTILTFCFGCLCGLICFSKVIKWLLEKHERITLSLMTGFILGSLKKIWPWNDKLNQWPDANTQTWVCLALMILGFTVVFGLDNLSKQKSKRGVSSAG